MKAVAKKVVLLREYTYNVREIKRNIKNERNEDIDAGVGATSP